jgi:hypothetical protein
MRIVVVAAALPFLASTSSGFASDAQFGGKYIETHKPDATPVADAAGHVFVIAHPAAVNQSTGATPFLQGAKVTQVWVADLVKGTGPISGYYKWTLGSSTITGKFDGKVTTGVGTDGKTPVTTSAGNWTDEAGTGQFAGIKGHGTWRSRMLSPTSSAVEWSGGIETRH